MSILISFITARTATPNDGTVGWVADPSGRGTFSLVFSSLLTLGLCVWSAMHLNIPSQHETAARGLMRNIRWGLIGVFAPELVVFAAWRQYSSAKQLYEEVKVHLRKQEGALGRNDEKSNTEGNEAWTMVHSFYAGMGGFVFDVNDHSEDEEPPFIPNSRRLTISARGVAFLVKCGHLPNIMESDIDDKSKADGLAKFLVCVQAAWMVVQVVGRVALGLPVTLLEVNVLGHVILAFVIYMMWWHKPRLVKEPTRLNGDWVRPLCAYMYMSSQVSGSHDHKVGLLRRTNVDPELASLVLCMPGTSAKLSEESNEKSVSNVSDEPATSQIFEVPSSTTKTESLVILNRTYFAPRPQPSSSEGRFVLSGEEEQVLGQNNLQLNRWTLAAEIVNSYPAVKLRYTKLLAPGETNDTCERFEPLTEELLTRGATNWPKDDLLRRTGGLIMGMSLWLASMAYGGVHISAWSGYFPSMIEAWLWRSSAIYITFSAAVWLVICLIAALSKTINDFWDRILALKAHWLSYVVIGFLCTVCGVAFIFARLFLVIEAWISLRRLPAGAYLTPDWTQLIPHF